MLLSLFYCGTEPKCTIIVAFLSLFTYKLSISQNSIGGIYVREPNIFSTVISTFFQSPDQKTK